MRFLLVIAAVGLIAAAIATAAPPQRPALRLVDSDPATFSGRAFKPREAVRITLVDAVAPSLRVRANRYGTFTASFEGVVLDRCEQVFVRAIGAQGSRAAYKRLPAPMCLVSRTTD
jgi:hypothetical protein